MTFERRHEIGRSNDMPSWGQALEDDEKRGLLAFVRGFCGKTVAAAAPH